MSSTSVFAFIFDGDHPILANDFLIGPPCTSRVVQAAERLHLTAAVRVIRGKIIPECLAYDMTSFALGGKADDSVLETTRSDPSLSQHLGEYRSISIGPQPREPDTFSQTPDQDRFRVIVADLAETLSVSPSTTKTYELLFTIGAGLPWSVSLSGLTLKQAITIDKELKAFPPYLGMAALDLGNPTHRAIMIEKMFHKDVFLDELGSISRIESGLDDEDRKEAMIHASWIGSTGQVRLLESDDFDEALPPLDYPSENSARGEISRARLAGKLRPNHRDNLIHALLAAVEASPPGNRIEFSTALDAGVTKFILPPEKFTEYLFNVKHPKGAGKAKALIESLGIDPVDWRFLADQIERAMDEAPLYKVKEGKWGINYGALVLVEGRNGRLMVLETGWIVESGKPARFVTAYPGPEELGVSLRQPVPFVVEPTLSGNERWNAIYQRALVEAGARANAIQPTPITEGEKINWDGRAGKAKIVIKMSEGGFPQWLLEQKLGIEESEICVIVASTTRSLARNEAFAEGMAEVINANGVLATVQI